MSADGTSESHEKNGNKEDNNGQRKMPSSSTKLRHLNPNPVVHETLSTSVAVNKPRPARILTNQLEYLKKLVNETIRHEYAWPFRNPVDYEKLGIPDYPTIVRQPMDLGTVRHRLMGKFYYSAKECLAELNQIFVNCYIFNRPDIDIVTMALKVEQFMCTKLLQEMPAEEHEISTSLPTKPVVQASSLPPGDESKPTQQQEGAGPEVKSEIAAPASTTGSSAPNAPNSIQATPCTPATSVVSDQMSTSVSSVNAAKRKYTKRRSKNASSSGDPAEMDAAARALSHQPQRVAKLPEWTRQCAQVLRDVMSSRYREFNYLFMQPVDVEGLKLYDYPEIIKEPMDLGTMKEKLETNKYNSKEEFASDFQLMLDNCYTYNGRDGSVAALAKKMGDIFEDLFRRYVLNVRPEPELSDGGGGGATNKNVPILPLPELSVEQEDDLKTISLESRITFEKMRDVAEFERDLLLRVEAFATSLGINVATVQHLLTTKSLCDMPPPTSLASLIPASCISRTRKRETSAQDGQRKRLGRPPGTGKKQREAELYHAMISGGSSGMRSAGDVSAYDFNAAFPPLANATPKHQDFVNGRKRHSTNNERPGEKMACVTPTEAQPMTYEEKRQLSININSLPPYHLAQVIEITRRTAGANVNSDEIELDFEAMSPVVLRELEAYVAAVLPRQGGTSNQLPVTSHLTQSQQTAAQSSTTLNGGPSHAISNHIGGQSSGSVSSSDYTDSHSGNSDSGASTSESEE